MRLIYDNLEIIGLNILILIPIIINGNLEVKNISISLSSIYE